MTLFTEFRNVENTKEFKEGSVIFNKGESGDVMYVVLEGEVEIKLENIPVNEIGPDEIFGEMALVSDAPRMATAYAKTDCRLALVDEDVFLTKVCDHPKFALKILRVMADRLEKSTQKSIEARVNRMKGKVLDALAALD